MRKLAGGFLWRFDIVVWSKGGSVAGLIEIKDQPVMQNYTQIADPKKICDALRRWPDVRWGLFLFSVRSSGASRGEAIALELRRKCEAVFSSISAKFPKNVTKTRILGVSGRDSKLAWGGVVLRAVKPDPTRGN
jgi:hypothetical protein